MNIPPPGTHLIKNNNNNTPVRGKISEIKSKYSIIIEWDKPIGKISYTETMIKESLSLNIISIDKQYHRNQKINQIIDQII